MNNYKVLCYLLLLIILNKFNNYQETYFMFLLLILLGSQILIKTIILFNMVGNGVCVQN